MFRYVIADIKRISKRTSFIILSVLLLIVFFVATFSREEAPSEMFSTIDLVRAMTRPVIIVFGGFVAIMFIFGDDLKAKTSQIAIGIGISRLKIIMGKWIEVIFLTLISALVAFAGIFIGNMFSYSRFSFTNWMEIVSVVIMAIISVSVYMAFTMILIYLTKSTVLPILLYVFLGTGLINKLFGYFGYIQALERIHITSMTMTSLLNSFQSRLILGYFSPLQFLGIIVYIVVSLTLTYLIFRKQEMDF